MDLRTMLIVIPVIAFICVIVLVIFLRRQTSRRLSWHVIATITKIEVEATSLSNGWVVTAQWPDLQTGQTITFRSHRLQFPPRLPIGGPVTVDVDPGNPTHYHMEL
jgi:hypothetical protein